MYTLQKKLILSKVIHEIPLNAPTRDLVFQMKDILNFTFSKSSYIRPYFFATKVIGSGTFGGWNFVPNVDLSKSYTSFLL